MYICTFIYIYIYTHVTELCVTRVITDINLIGTYTYTYTHTYTHPYKHTPTHTPTHTHTYTHTDRDKSVLLMRCST